MATYRMVSDGHFQAVQVPESGMLCGEGRQAVIRFLDSQGIYYCMHNGEFRFGNNLERMHTAEAGQWIVVSPHKEIEVYPDEKFQHRFAIVDQTHADGAKVDKPEIEETVCAYEARVTKLTVVPEGRALYSEQATTVEIHDQLAGEYVDVRQDTDTLGDQVISIDPENWPALRDAIDQLILQCKAGLE